MAGRKKTADSGTEDNKTKFISVSQNDTGYEYKRDRAQIMTFAKM